jgi:hypothetical protein
VIVEAFVGAAGGGVIGGGTRDCRSPQSAITDALETETMSQI